ncbi:hypothetical protein CAL19_12560 [Bordetella genomosp. 7]|uniref:Uncharacterized protein n=2 Tax=Bordetella genomosp. 7 TaxID=1416805 RepID=A0A261QZX1_9BORD|nr:hypothetical protein CAL19_12560 [Bordetella genomosp. 7]
MAHREEVASSHNNIRGTIMTFPTRFAASATPNEPGQKQPPSKSEENQTQQQKEDAARKQAQDDPNKQRTPQ